VIAVPPRAVSGARLRTCSLYAFLWSWSGKVTRLCCCLCCCRGCVACAQIHFLLLVSRQGKIRLTKFYTRYAPSERTRMLREVSTMVLNRSSKLCNFLEWKDKKIVYKRCVCAVFTLCAMCFTLLSWRLVSDTQACTSWPVLTTLITNSLLWKSSITSWRCWIATLAMYVFPL